MKFAVPNGVLDPKLLSNLALLSYLDLRSKFFKDLWSFGQVRGSKIRPVALPSMIFGAFGALLGASWALLSVIFRSCSLSWPLLLSLLAPLSLSEPTFFDFFRFSKRQNPPGTLKINEKPLVFLVFLLFSQVAQNCKDPSKMCPKGSQEASKTPPRDSQEAPR